MIDFPLGEVKRLAGLDVRRRNASACSAGSALSSRGRARKEKVAAPSWRPDMHGPADIVEEVVRIVGVDRIPATPFERGEAPRKPVLTPLQVRTRKPSARSPPAAWSRRSPGRSFRSQQAELFGGGKPELALANPIAADLSDMRPSLMPGLMASAQRNADRGFPDSALFELGQIFPGDRPEQQRTAAAGVRRGQPRPAAAAGTGRPRPRGGRVRRESRRADFALRARRPARPCR